MVPPRPWCWFGYSVRAYSELGLPLGSDRYQRPISDRHRPRHLDEEPSRGPNRSRPTHAPRKSIVVFLRSFQACQSALAQIEFVPQDGPRNAATARDPRSAVLDFLGFLCT